MMTTSSARPEIAAIQSYEFGQSRKPLDAVAKLVVGAVGTPNQQQLAHEMAALLSSGATLEAKRFACRQLAVIATEAQTAAIAPYLLDEDLSDMARYALQPVAGDAVDRALIDALAKANDDQAIGIATTLGARRTDRAVASLKKRAASGNAAVARAAIAALGRIGTPRAARALTSLNDHVAAERKYDVANALLLAASTLVAEGKGERAEAIYEDLVAPEHSDSVRKAAFLGLVRTGGLQDPETWRARLDQDPVLREAAAGYLRHAADRYVTLAEQQTAR